MTVKLFENPFNFDYMMYRYLFAVKDHIEEDTFSEVSHFKLQQYIEYIKALEPHLNIHQKMLFMDEMFSFNRFDLDSLTFPTTKEGVHQVSLKGTLKDSIPPFYYPSSAVTFSQVNLISALNGHKERVTLASVLRLPLLLQGVQPCYDERTHQHIVDIYVSVDIYNTQFDSLIKLDALSNICQIRFSYKESLIQLGLRHTTHNIFAPPEEKGEAV